MSRRLIEEEFADNIGRVENLLQLYDQVSEASLGTAEINTDLLRACVVFLHAALEEIIRNLHVSRIDIIEPAALSIMPFPNQNDGRSTKISLGELKAFEGKLVENVIWESVVQFTNRSNLNSSTDLSSALERVKISKDPFVALLPVLDAMMKRRHQIVHQMDRSDVLDPDTAPITSIDQNMVTEWRGAVRTFFDILMPIIL